MTPPVLKLATLVSMLFQENSYVAALAGRSDCLVVDPGLEPELILDYLEREQLVPAMILNTHGHSDHIAGNGALKERWPECPLVIGRGDGPMLGDPHLNLSAPFGMRLISPPADQLLEDGQLLSAAGFELEVRTIPGHSPGHVVYLWREASPPLVFVGDVIFAGSIGRTDFPGGSFAELAAGIRQKLFSLPAETQLYSGHGPLTTVGRERRHNPFVGEEATAQGD